MKIPKRHENAKAELRRSAEMVLQNRGSSSTPEGEFEVTRLLHELQVHQIELQMQNEELRRAEEEAREHAAELAAIYRYAPCIMLLIDANRRVRKANEFAAAFAGRSWEELIGLRSCEALRCQNALNNPLSCGLEGICLTCPIRRASLDTIESGQVHHQEEVRLITSAAGKADPRVFILSSVPLILQQKPMVLVSMLDITEGKRAEEEREEATLKLRQTEKMAALGQLAGGIAHNFNNQLAGILGFADLLRTKLEDETLRQYTDNIIICSKRASELTAQLLAFSHKGEQKTIPVDMHSLIVETITLLSRIVDPRIDIRQSLSAHGMTVMGDPTQLQNLLLNFGLNARDAMPEGGRLVFTSVNVELMQKNAAEMGVAPGNYLRICVTDTGAGMSQHTLDHLFEPFFTTKEAGKGTGLGLAVVQGTIVSHHGAVTAESQEGQSSTFTIYLPTAEASPSPVSSEPAATPAKGNARIMIVDDDKLVLLACSELLRDLGYSVTECKDGVVAVECYQRCWREIDLVILDMVMPRMGGREAFAAMRAINPHVKVLVSSGYSPEGEARGMMDDGARAFLQKPFNIDDLSSKVMEALCR